MKEIGTLFFLGLNACIDIRKKQISLVITGIYALAGIIWSLSHGRELWQILFSMGIGLFFLAISMITKGAFGVGDGLLLLALGTVLDGQELLMTACIGLFASAILAAVFLVVRKKGRKEEIPFVPFLLLGYLGGFYL